MARIGGAPLPTITDDSALGGAVIEKSLRFNRSDSAYLSKAQVNPTSNQIASVSVWLKRTDISTDNTFFDNYQGTNDRLSISLLSSTDGDALSVYQRDSSGIVCLLTTTQVFRDPTSWYHLLIAFDTTQSTEADRVKIYVNGTQVTSFSSSTYFSQNHNLRVGPGYTTNIGRYGAGSNYFGGYLAEFNYIDGQQLSPTDVGFTEFQTGAWKPKRYEGSYGNNGFRLDFSDNSSTTTLGIDKSPNGNDYTTNNFSVSSGKDGDSFIDTPTNNFPTLNPLVRSNAAQSLSDGNLTRSGSAKKCMATFEALNGKYYFEYKAEDGNGNHAVGVCQITTDQRDRINTEAAACFASNGEFKIEDNSQTSGFASWGNGDIISVAIDTTLTTPKVWFAVNNSWQAASGNSGTFNPSGGYSLTSGKKYTFTVDHGSNSSSTTGTCFFGAHQGGFNYDPPSGFKALSSKNLPIPTNPIINPDQHFKAVTYTGNAGTNQINGLKFKPDMIWFKSRSSTSTNGIADSVRGRSKLLFPDSDQAEETSSSTRDLRSFDDDGFTLGNPQVLSSTNGNGLSIAAWCWKGGGASVSNSDGSVTTTISANPEAGFSIVDYNGGGNGSTMGHGLGAVPHWIIIKKRDSDSPGNARGWAVFHRSLPTDKPLRLNSTTQQLSEANFFREDLMSTSVFGVNGDYDTGYSGDDYMAYVWTEIPGFSRFGSYVGNGNADGVFVHCGFRPAFVLCKMYDGINENWTISDSTRSTYNPVDLFLRPDESTIDTSGAAKMDFCAQGFKLRNNDDKTNRDGGKYIFAAFAEQSPVTPYDEFTNAR